MSKPVPVGTRAEVEETVQFEQTLTHRHAELPPVYSTPDMIELMEMACFHALQPFAEGDEITVGTHIDVVHKAAVSQGAKVKASAEMESFDGRFYRMKVRSWADASGQEIGSGYVGRAFVSVGKFLRRAQAQD